ncbi:MAG: alpha/beta fold hydrolase [Bacteroidota bacterium]
MKTLLAWIILLTTPHVFGQKPVRNTGTITIGGIKQYISFRGNDDTKPLLLFLHGGPGGSVMSYAHKFTARLQENFIVVQWDQREAGETLKLNSSPLPLSLSLFENDTHEMIDSLLKRFHRQKLYLVGHSWGTVLGFDIAKKIPDRLYAFVAISPVINQLESERIILSKMKEKAKSQQEIEELDQIKIPFETWEDLYYHRKWLFAFNGQTVRSFSKSFASNWAATWLHAWNEAASINLMESLPAIRCPVYFFIGTKDYQTNFKIAEDYFNKVQAPKKQIYWFEQTGHSIPSAQPRLMQEIIVEKIFPETYQR